MLSVQIYGQACIVQCSFLALQRPQSAAEALMHGESLELVEAIEAAMGRNREIEKISHERILSLLNIMSSLKKRHSIALLFFCYQV